MLSDGTTRFPVASASSSAFVRRMVGGVALIIMFVFGMVAFSLYQSFGEYEERSEIMAQNLSRLLALDIGREIEKIDVTLLTAVDEIERQLARGVDRKGLNVSLGQLQGHVPEITSLRATDVDGIVRYGQGVDIKAHLNNSDREYFIRQRDDFNAGLVVAKPVLARIDKRWVITFSRAVHLRDGSFGGVVYANVALEHLAQMFSSIDVGPHGSVSLRDAELRIFAHYPVPKEAEKIYGQKLDVPELKALIQSGRDFGTYTSRYTLDGIERKNAVHRVDGLNLYAVVGRSTDEYMAPWREQVFKTLLLAFLFCLTTLASSWLIYRSWKRQMSATIELAREEEKFHTVADYTYDWEYWEGPGREILYMSPSCERVTGYSQSEFVAAPDLISRITHPDDLNLLSEHRHDVAFKDEAAVDFRIVRKSGEIRWIAHACQSVFGRDGMFMGRRVSNRDITERKQAEASLFQFNAELEQRVAQRTAELETAIYDLENFNYSASHDLRIPLRAVDGFSWLLLEEHAQQLDAEGKRLLNVVRENTRRMSQLIDDMQSFTRTGRMVLVYVEVDMNGLVREVMEELKPSTAGRKVRLEILDIPHVRSDLAMLRRIMVHLLANAIKFTRPMKQAVIEVGARTQDRETVIYVKDNGVGFDMRFAGQLFGVFQRLHGVEEFEGAGIGLAIVKRIITRMGGRVWAEGKVNEGATFYFSIPFAETTGSKNGGVR